ncbi:MAG: polyvinylalcohol dehydrogenase [Blastopirellula sp.]|nr:MAG: polyvinylalcohol dehydrogenase [Blastopirellula sp.]
MNSRVMTLSMLFAMTAVACYAAKPGDNSWSQWRGPLRDGKSTSTGLLQSWEDQQPQALWSLDGMGSGFASVSIADGMLYTTGNFKDQGQGVVAINLKTKEVAWKQVLTDSIPQHGYKGSRCTPTIDGDRLYVVLSDGTVACLSAKDGDVKWKHNFQEDWKGKKPNWGFAESPLIDGDKLVCTPGAEGALIVALDKMTGKEIWATDATDALGKKGKDDAGYSSIMISEGAGVRQYVQLVGKGVVGVDTETGKLLWNYNPVANGTANIPTCIVDGDLVFASTGYGAGACLLKLSKDGTGVKAEEVYYLDGNVFQNHHGGMIQLGDYIYAGTKHGKGIPICIEMKTGEIQWGGDIRGEGKGSAAVTYADGHLLFRYESGDIALIEATPEEYRMKGKFMPEYQEQKSWAHPVVLDGLLYLREQNKLMVYDLRK